MSNNSGVKTQVIQNLSRALSTDINALQHFTAASFTNAFRRMYNDSFVLGNSDNSSWNEFVSPVNGTGVSADVTTGLKVRPFSNYLLVSPGILGVHGTTTSYNSAVDSDYMLVSSDGVTSATELPFVANGSGIRIDIVEAALVETITTTSQDIYNPTTGVFTATLLTNTLQVSLQFTIRQGSSGAGYPGVTTGSLPLCVLIHNGATSTFADVDLYDVRPLLASRISGDTRMVLGNRFIAKNGHYYGMNNSGTQIGGTFDLQANTTNSFSGSFTVHGYYRMRGRIAPTRPGGPDVETTNWAFTTSDYAVSMATPNSARWMYVLAVEPYGLPRWSRYTTGNSAITGEREPSDNWGLYIIADSLSCDVLSSGKLSAPVLLPADYGIIGTHPASVVAIFRQETFGNVSTVVRRDGFVAGANGPFIFDTISSAAGTGFVTKEVSFGTVATQAGAIPGYCSGITVELGLLVTPGAITENFVVTVEFQDGLGNAVNNSKEFSFVGIPSGNTSELRATFDFVLPSTDIIGVASSSAYKMVITVAANGVGSIPLTLTSGSYKIQGFWIGH